MSVVLKYFSTKKYVGMKKPKQLHVPSKSVRKTKQGPALSPRLQEEFEKFIRHYPASRLSSNLRTLLLEFLMYDGSAEANYLRPLVIDLTGLFNLLQVVQEERPEN